jgi:hypothetical protein
MSIKDLVAENKMLKELLHIKPGKFIAVYRPLEGERILTIDWTIDPRLLEIVDDPWDTAIREIRTAMMGFTAQLKAYGNHQTKRGQP